LFGLLVIGAKNAVETPPVQIKKPVADLKEACKTMNQNKNDQNHKKESAPVVDNKPNGKSRRNRRV